MPANSPAPHTPPAVPAVVTIGHIRYRVAVDDIEIRQASDATHSDLAGYSNLSEQLIALREDNPPDYQAETLLHEVLHQAFATVGLDIDADAKARVPEMEERVVRSLSGVLLHTLRSNPELVAYLTHTAAG